jgi:hypothetical protein
MATTRIEQAIDEIDTSGDEFEASSCDDIRLAWLAQALDGGPAAGSDFEAVWTDR